MNHSSSAKMAAMILAAAFFAATATAQEPVKIATVDLLKAFDGYWKTKLSNDQLKGARSRLRQGANRHDRRFEPAPGRLQSAER